MIELLEPKPELQDDFEILEKDFESRVSNLEDEVKQSQEDFKFIQDLLGMNLDKHNSDKT